MILSLLLEAVTQSQKLNQTIHTLDPYGVGITAIGMGVVFISLLLLYLAFFNTSKFLLYRTKKRVNKSHVPGEIEKKVEMDAEVNAAIALALSMYFQEVHDKEAGVLTINKTARTYSPWSSKIYGLRQSPR